MVIFLYLKQILDIFYQIPLVSNLLFVLACVLIVFQIVLERPSVKKSIKIADVLIILITIILFMTFCRDDFQSKNIFFGIFSAIIMYLFGRVNYERILESNRTLVYSGYVVIYVNFFFRFLHLGVFFPIISNAQGNLYQDDTQMACAVLTAMTFVIMYERNSFFKYFTTLFVSPIIILYSDAGIHILLMMLIYFIVIVYLFELVLDKRKISNILLAVMVVGLLFATMFIHLPVIGVIDDQTVLTLLGGRYLDHNNMYGRYVQWREIWNLIRQSDFVKLMLGHSLAYQEEIGSLYIKTLYSLGVVGLSLLLIFVAHVVYCVTKVKDRTTFYVTIILCIMLLATGIVKCSIESTQLSWMPMMYIGMVIASTRTGDIRK